MHDLCHHDDLVYTEEEISAFSFMQINNSSYDFFQLNKHISNTHGGAMKGAYIKIGNRD